MTPMRGAMFQQNQRWEGTGKGKGDGGGDGCRRTIFWDMTTGGMYECAAPPPLFDRPPPICCSKDCATPPMVPE